MSARNHPIGIFDSGVGGLTVVQAVHDLLPHEDIVYLGDTARVPYGNKSPETIVQYARQDTQFLIQHQVKAVVVACNTATAHGLADLQARFSIPILGVIEPGVEAALAATQTGSIGIIGTVGTIQSGAYQNALMARNPNLKITAAPTPLLVPLIEEDWLNHAATHLILAEYLSPLTMARMDTLVLACTHYPLVKRLIKSIVQSDVTLVDSAENMALSLRRCLEEKGLAKESNGKMGSIDIHVTDLSPHFPQLARRFLGGRVGAIHKADLEQNNKN